MIHEEWYWESGQPLGTLHGSTLWGAAKNKKIHSSGHWRTGFAAQLKEIPSRLNNAVCCCGFMVAAAQHHRHRKSERKMETEILFMNYIIYEWKDCRRMGRKIWIESEWIGAQRIRWSFSISKARHFWNGMHCGLLLLLRPIDGAFFMFNIAAIHLHNLPGIRPTTTVRIESGWARWKNSFDFFWAEVEVTWTGQTVVRSWNWFMRKRSRVL